MTGFRGCPGGRAGSLWCGGVGGAADGGFWGKGRICCAGTKGTKFIGFSYLLFQLSVFVPLFNLIEILNQVNTGQGGLFSWAEEGHTPMMVPNLTRPGSFLPFDRRPHSMRAFSSVAQSTARKGILLAFRMVSMRDVAVMM